MSSNFIAAGAVIVSAMGAIFGLYQARKADKSATKTKASEIAANTIAVGVKDLVDQYREVNEELRDEAHECTERCKKLEIEVKALKRKVEKLETDLDAREAEVLRLKRQLGESIT